MTATLTEERKKSRVKGNVTKAFGNLLHVRYHGDIRQGEVANVHVDSTELKAEVLEIAGDEAKIQVFEDTRGVELGTEVTFTGDLLEAELGPGLLSTIYDGLQNPLKVVADHAGYFLPKGVYLNAIDRSRQWDFEPSVKVGDTVERGDTLGIVMEGRFHHRIMVPFAKYGRYTIEKVVSPGTYHPDHVIATVKDSDGEIHEFTMIQRWPIKAGIQAGTKVKPEHMMSTGLRIMDTQFPIIKGGSFCTPGPFGAGKTVLQHHLSKYSDVDIVVVCACGERAGEVVEILQEFPHLIDPHTDEPLMSRTIIICNTSSMPVAARESSIYMGMTIAEYYRQMGLDVLLLADSTSRWAQALREMSGRLEEIPGEEAFPAYLASRIAEFYERSGVIRLGDGSNGSVTICGAVSPAGGNFEEPVTQATLSVVGAFIGLSRERSDARRYPAIGPLMSWSKYVDQISKELEQKVPNWGKMVKRANWFLHQGDEIGKRMEVVGEEGTAISDLVIFLKSELYDFTYLQQNAFDREDAYCPLDRQIPLFLLINRIFDKEFTFKTHEAAREYFIKLQNMIKDMNFMPYESEAYFKALKAIEEMIE